MFLHHSLKRHQVLQIWSLKSKYAQISAIFRSAILDSLVFTLEFFSPPPNTEISTYVQKYKLHNEFSDSGPLATYTGVNFAHVYTCSSNSAHKHNTFLKFQHPSDPATCGSPASKHESQETVAGSFHVFAQITC